ncbi:GAF domain-containing SpoIIE family protein phosphatase [Actinoplanes sp. NBRC 103695]|uniref:PP2C family protein-serine/threonine phosphatase n=1 Tax=Actinoplanes sp. NBRC 103695 TaxID=3032202 RepID=UPI0025557047|nr:GAF domain-containing SpoIIE family protein phosphatase [Actinoplanes sp. NBRC 103695]
MTVADDRLMLPARLAAVRRSGLLDTGAEEPFDRLTRLACELLGSPFGFVTIVDDRRSFWKSCVGTTSSEVADRQNPVGESFCQYVIAADGPIVIDDARLNPMTRDNPSIHSMGVIAWAGFPVRSLDGYVLGTFCVVDNAPRRWSAQDLRTLEVLAQAAGGEAGLRIRAEEALQEAARARTAAAEYEQLARTLQESLLPRELPVVDGLDIAAAYQLAGGDVLGDFYDLVQTPTGWAVFLGDVAGKGAHAARTAGLARYTLRAGAARATSPAIVLTELDAALHRWFAETDVPGFVTVAYVAIRPNDNGFGIRICAAGHPTAVIRRRDGALEPVGQTSSPLGILPKLSLAIQDAALRPGDSLILCTNAVLARAASDLVPFGDVLAETLTADARDTANAIIRRASAGSGRDVRDDMVAVTIRVPDSPVS